MISDGTNLTLASTSDTDKEREYILQTHEFKIDEMSGNYIHVVRMLDLEEKKIYKYPSWMILESLKMGLLRISGTKSFYKELKEAREKLQRRI